MNYCYEYTMTSQGHVNKDSLLRYETGPQCLLMKHLAVVLSQNSYRT